MSSTLSTGEQTKAFSGVSDIEQYLLAQENLKQLELNELESNKIWAKAQFMEEGEKSTRYFLSLEKSRTTNQTIRVLTKDNLDTVTEIQDLLSETRTFYQNLYSAEECDENEQGSFFTDEFPRLKDNEGEFCEGYVTEEELRKAVVSMENDKSPGLDGLTTNFYKHFWPLIADSVIEVDNYYAFRVGHLTVSQRRGIISLLFKKGDRTLLKNWRRIILLTTNHKILSKALANRLQKVLPSLVHTDQTASILGRTINDNSRPPHDVIYHANEMTSRLLWSLSTNWKLSIVLHIVFFFI